MRLLWEEEAWEDYCLWQTRDKKLLKRINTLLKDIQRNSYEGIGKPEPLKGDLSGWWSRRIDDTHRIVYKEQDGNIITCKGPGFVFDFGLTILRALRDEEIAQEVAAALLVNYK